MNIAWIAWSFHKPFHLNVRICVCPCYYKTKSTITISNITLRGHSLFPRSCQLLYAGRHCGTNWIIFFHEDYHPLEEKVMLLWDFFPLIFFFFSLMERQGSPVKQPLPETNSLENCFSSPSSFSSWIASDCVHWQIITYTWQPWPKIILTFLISNYIH